VTWCKRVESGPRPRGRRRIPLPGLLIALLLGGCGVAPPGPASPPPGARISLAAQPAPPRRAAVGPAGLLPLPSPLQLGQTVTIGRFDPFASLHDPLPKPAPPRAAAVTPGAKPASAGSRAGRGQGAQGRRPIGPPPLPRDFRVSGMLRAGAQAYAVVETGGISGSLRPGDRGGRTTDLLPPGWSVAAVDVARGRLVLQWGRQQLSLDR
jgi:hypothetical protein